MVTYLSENLRVLRKSLKLSQGDISDKIGVNRGRYQMWERGSTPPLEILLKISQVFKITVDDLISKKLTESTIKENKIPTDPRDSINPERIKKMSQLMVNKDLEIMDLKEQREHMLSVMKRLIELIEKLLPEKEYAEIKREFQEEIKSLPK